MHTCAVPAILLEFEEGLIALIWCSSPQPCPLEILCDHQVSNIQVLTGSSVIINISSSITRVSGQVHCACSSKLLPHPACMPVCSILQDGLLSTISPQVELATTTHTALLACKHCGNSAKPCCRRCYTCYTLRQSLLHPAGMHVCSVVQDSPTLNTLPQPMVTLVTVLALVTLLAHWWQTQPQSHLEALR